jgi:hypothetical protein
LGGAARVGEPGEGHASRELRGVDPRDLADYGRGLEVRMSNVDFSSWPPHQEQSFLVYEQQRDESQRKAWMIGAAVAGGFLFFMIMIYFVITPTKLDLTKDMNMSNITKKTAK